MTRRRTVGTIIVLTLGGVVWTTAAVSGAQARRAGTRPREVTLTGKLVDLQSYMTGEFGSLEPAKFTLNAIRSGVPTALETEEGLIVIGMGDRGPSRLMMPLASAAHVELKGKLYEKAGLQYIDITAAQALKDEEPEEGEEEEGAEEEP